MVFTMVFGPAICGLCGRQLLWLDIVQYTTLIGGFSLRGRPHRREKFLNGLDI